MGNTVSNTKKTAKNESINDISTNILDLSEVDSLNWNNLNTDEMSVSDNQIISNHNINSGALEYLNDMNIPSVSESEDVFTFNTQNKIIDINFDNKLTDSISSNSPFISSEMYKFVMKGGAEHEEDADHDHNDDSESSATSSSGEDKSEDKSKSDEMTQTAGSSVTSASYISSSDHCGGPDSEDEKNTTSVISTDDRVVSSSLNTSDINLISLKH